MQQRATALGAILSGGLLLGALGPDALLAWIHEHIARYAA